jgi:hypothetical protein
MAAASWLLCLVHFHKEARIYSRSFFMVFHADGNIRVSRELVATAVKGLFFNFPVWLLHLG